jgi:hypothetical protein
MSNQLTVNGILHMSLEALDGFFHARHAKCREKQALYGAELLRSIGVFCFFSLRLKVPKVFDCAGRSSLGSNFQILGFWTPEDNSR